MKSPKNANICKHHSQTFIFPYNQSMDLEYELIKEHNQRLSKELERLKKEMNMIDSNITVDNLLNLMYNILTISFRIPNKTAKANSLWSKLKNLKNYFKFNVIEGLKKAEIQISEWLISNCRTSSKA